MAGRVVTHLAPDYHFKDHSHMKLIFEMAIRSKMSQSTSDDPMKLIRKNHFPLFADLNEFCSTLQSSSRDVQTCQSCRKD